MKLWRMFTKPAVVLAVDFRMKTACNVYTSLMGPVIRWLYVRDI